MDIKRIAIGADHAGFVLKEVLKSALESAGYSVMDFGPDTDARMDYPDTAAKVAEAVHAAQAQVGVLCCGSGIGMAMTANRFPGVRAVVCGDIQTALLSRKHNNANVICFGQRIIAPEYAQELFETFVATAFEGGRHEGRVDKMDHVKPGAPATCP